MSRASITALLTIAIAAGCVPTLNPVYTEGDLIFEDAVLGLWRQKDSTATWDFTRAGENGYTLVYTDQEGRSGRFTARLANVGGVKFLDLFPVKEDLTSNDFYKFHLLPIHTVYIVRQTSPTLQLSGFDLKWLNSYLKENPEALAHSTYNGNQLITATTEELQRFLLEHQDRFTVNFEVVRTSP